MVDSSTILREVSDIDAFLADPIGHYIRRPGFTYWYPWPGFTGFALVGRPTADEIRELNVVMDVVLPPRADTHISLIDTSCLEGVEQEAFVAMATYLATRREIFARLIRRQALVRPSGVVGAVVAGFYRVVSAAYPVEVFERVTDAALWLGLAQPMDFAQTLLGFHQADTQPDHVLLQLREHLRKDLTQTTLRQVARGMGMSIRTLQRRLNRSRTSFQSELNAAQIGLGKQLMLESDATLTEIAYAVKCSSLQHFSSMFRKLTSETPSDWRERHRGVGLSPNDRHDVLLQTNGA